MADRLLDAAWIYAALGLAVAAAFLTVGIGRVSPPARGAYTFRPLLVPGIVLLWPLVLARWLHLERHTSLPAHHPPRRLQAALAVLLAAAIPGIVLGALLLRQDGPREAEPVLIAPPEEPDR